MAAAFGQYCVCGGELTSIRDLINFAASAWAGAQHDHMAAYNTISQVAIMLRPISDSAGLHAVGIGFLA